MTTRSAVEANPSPQNLVATMSTSSTMTPGARMARAALSTSGVRLATSDGNTIGEGVSPPKPVIGLTRPGTRQ